MSAAKIQTLFIRLFPQTGRAFKIPYMGIFWRLLRALSLSFNRAFVAASSIFDSIFPDNDNFTAEDAAIQERLYGLPTNTSVPLADRKLAIYRRIAHPGEQPARQGALFIEQQLQSAGFDVYVYENRFFEGSPASWITKTPSEVLGITAGYAVYGGFAYGETEYAGTWADDGITVIANYLEEAKDALFDFGDNYRSAFFIAGASITTFADVPAVRRTEFRQLLLTLKPTNTAGWLFVNYT
jgi:hypothetical protein